MLPLTVALIHLWHEDPLRSVGIFFPFISIVLVVSAWRDTGWSWHSSLWGFLPLGLAVMLARILGEGVVTYRFHSHSLSLLQPGLFFFAYGSGVVLLLGGRRLWRASLFPLLLLFCVNPVPHLFNSLIDLPMQAASANTARSFAHLLGLRPSGEQLQMLFAPRFGMMIVPGCNGMRGALTMGYMMLLLGYWKRYRPLLLGLCVVAAVALGYLLNLIRLCLLVLYYWAGIHIAALRPHGEGIDYLIGGILFLLITSLAGWIFLRNPDSVPPRSGSAPLPWHVLFGRWQIRLLIALLLLCSLPEIPSAFARVTKPGEGFTDVRRAMEVLPLQAGTWHRGAFSFEAQEIDQQTIWIWAPYTDTLGRSVEFGVWLSPLQHYALNSRRIHGDTPTWTGTLNGHSVTGDPIRLSAFTMSDEFSQGNESAPTLFAETTCWADRPCTDASMVGFGRQGLSIAVAPVSARSQLRLSLLLKIPEVKGEDAAQARRTAEDAAKDLLSTLDLRQFTREMGTVGP